MKSKRKKTSGSILVPIMIAGSLSLLGISFLLKLTQQKQLEKKIRDIQTTKKNITEHIKERIQEQDVLFLSSNITRTNKDATTSNDRSQLWNEYSIDKKFEHREFVFAFDQTNKEVVYTNTTITENLGNKNFITCMLGREITADEKENNTDPILLLPPHKSTWFRETTEDRHNTMTNNTTCNNLNSNDEKIKAGCFWDPPLPAATTTATTATAKLCIAQDPNTTPAQRQPTQRNWQEIILRNPINKPLCISEQKNISAKIAAGCFLSGTLNSKNIGYSLRANFSGFYNTSRVQNSIGPWGADFPIKTKVEFAPKCNADESIQTCTFAQYFLFRITLTHPSIITLAKITTGETTDNWFETTPKITNQRLINETNAPSTTANPQTPVSYIVEISRAKIMGSECNPGAKVVGMTQLGDIICDCAHPFKAKRKDNDPAQPVLKNAFGPICISQAKPTCPNPTDYLIGIDPRTNKAICQATIFDPLDDLENTYESDETRSMRCEKSDGTKGWITSLKHECVGHFTFHYEEKWENDLAKKASVGLACARVAEAGWDLISVIGGPVGRLISKLENIPFLGSLVKGAVMAAVGGICVHFLEDSMDPPTNYGGHDTYGEGNAKPIGTSYPKCLSVAKQDNSQAADSFVNSTWFKAISVITALGNPFKKRKPPKKYKKWGKCTKSLAKCQKRDYNRKVKLKKALNKDFLKQQKPGKFQRLYANVADKAQCLAGGSIQTSIVSGGSSAFRPGIKDSSPRGIPGKPRKLSKNELARKTKNKRQAKCAAAARAAAAGAVVALDYLPFSFKDPKFDPASCPKVNCRYKYKCAYPKIGPVE